MRLVGLTFLASVGILLATAVLLGRADAEPQGSKQKALAPEQITIDYLADRFGPVQFNHEMHTMYATGCGQCHHGHDVESNKLCGLCHGMASEKFINKAERGFLPCSGCHGQYDSEVPSLPGFKVAIHTKCFACHVGIGGLGSGPEACANKCHKKQAAPRQEAAVREEAK